MPPRTCELTAPLPAVSVSADCGSTAGFDDDTGHTRIENEKSDERNTEQARGPAMSEKKHRKRCRRSENRAINKEEQAQKHRAQQTRGEDDGRAGQADVGRCFSVVYR